MSAQAPGSLGPRGMHSHRWSCSTSGLKAPAASSWPPVCARRCLSTGPTHTALAIGPTSPMRTAASCLQGTPRYAQYWALSVTASQYKMALAPVVGCSPPVRETRSANILPCAPNSWLFEKTDSQTKAPFFIDLAYLLPGFLGDV